eukprot:EG_transcript_20030
MAANPVAWDAPAAPSVDDGFFQSNLSTTVDTLGFYEGPSSSLGKGVSWQPPEPAASPFPGQPAVAPPFPMQPPGPAPATAAPQPGGIPMGIPMFGPAMPQLSISAPQLGGAPVYSLGFWQSLFDVDTKDVQGRLRSALLLRPPEYLSAQPYGHVPQVPDVEDGAPSHTVNRNPDFYGPLWIGATLCLVLVVISHTLNAIQCATVQQKKTCTQSWFAPVALGCSLVFGFELLVPVGLWVVMRWKDVPLALMELVCLYGYSFAAFVPATVLWVLPWSWLRWVVFFGAFGLSSANIVRNLLRVWQQHLEPQWLLGA